MRRFLRLHAASAVSSTHSTEGGRTIGRFHIRDAHKRRGDNLPARLRFTVHRGVTLVELMISMLILTLVCVAWLEIIGIQSAKKEARRREAVERLVGMMDVFMFVARNNSLERKKISSNSYYFFERNGDAIKISPASGGKAVYPVFEDNVSPVGYQLSVVETKSLPDHEKFVNWDSTCRWLVGKLYDGNSLNGVDKGPFFTLPVFLGF